MKSYVFIETYGCSANKNNSEILAGLLKQAGYEITNNSELADIIIINSCVVKGKTENKIKRRIQDLNQSKNTKIRHNLLIITGCMPETDAKQIKQLNEKTILLGTHHVKDIVKIIRDFEDNKLDWKKQNEYLSEQNEEKILLPKIPSNNLISITQISEGCLGNCTYCKTRLAKGKLFSYPEEKIIESIENDLKSGAKEVWITSQDCANYGLDRDDKKHKLIPLLKKIISLKHNFKIRLGMSDPNNVFPILDELIEIYKDKKMYKFLHIPIQSGSNKILRDMNRLYSIEQVETVIKKFRKEIPNITLATDIIIGYPTEEEEDFKDSLNFINNHSPDVLNLSKMSIHKRTKIENLKPLPIKTINRRTTKIMAEHRKTALKNKEKFLNKNIKIFINRKLPGFYEARDDNYNIVLINSNDKSILGKSIDVNIKSIGVHHMIGEIRK